MERAVWNFMLCHGFDNHQLGKLHDTVGPDMGYKRHPIPAGLFLVLQQRAFTALARLQKAKHQWSEAKEILVPPLVLVLLLTGCVPSLSMSVSLSANVGKLFAQIFSGSNNL